MKTKFLAAQKRLLITWLAGASLLFGFFILQTITGRYNGVQNDAWAWFLPNILPTLLLMISSFFASIRTVHSQEDFQIERIYYWISMGISITYMFVLMIVLVTYSPDKGRILEYYRSSSVYLVALQSLVSLSLGFFFVKK